MYYIIFTFCLFVYGITIGKYEIFPHDQLKYLQDIVFNHKVIEIQKNNTLLNSKVLAKKETENKEKAKLRAEIEAEILEKARLKAKKVALSKKKAQPDAEKVYDDLLKESLKSPSHYFRIHAFSKKAPKEQLIYPPLNNIDDLYFRNKKILMNSDWYDEIYSKISVNSIIQHYKDSETPIINIGFTINKKKFNAYAYGIPLRNCGNANVSTALIIPGSGNNQSKGIYKNDKKNYHFGIIDALENVSNILVQIKPNRDARSWHNGIGKRVNGNFVYNWQIQMGGSYSLSYVIEAIALVKYIKSCSHKSIVAGLSQGGAATLYVAIESNPDIAIVASGYSILGSKIQYAGFSQLLGIPNSKTIATENGFINSINKSKTKFLFTWGLKENFDYLAEAQNKMTSILLEKINNAKGITHKGGHIFPNSEIRDFIKQHLYN